ncbi:MAG: transporter substrate-binding domain-containing protein, partial [Oscillospiraceae bacterium]
MKKILFKGLSFALAVMLLIGSITLFATDEETETLKVGYVPNYGMESGVFENNTPSRGYGYDFLNKIAEYANWKYEFVNVSFNDGMSMLENGELDIFGPVFKTSDREKQFLYQDIEMGYEYTYVYANENSECYYNDFESLNGKKIGIQKSSVYVDTFNKFAKENNINADVALIESSDFQNQLDLGNVDFVVDGSTLNLNNVKVVAKLGYNGYYYPVSKKRPDVLGKMNAAIEKILQDDIYYRAKLEQKYFTKNSPASFSRQEIEFINQNPVIKVGYNPNWEPIEGTKKG